MKKIIIIISLLLWVAGIPAFSQDAKKIGILVQKEATATYDETLQGLTEYLKIKGLATFVDIENAKNDKETMKKIALDYADNPAIKIIVVMGSSAVVVVNENVKTKPVIFGGINHPDGLGIKGSNITGTTYYIKPKSMVTLIKQIYPKIKKIGILFEPPEQNGASKVEVPELEQACKAEGIIIIEESVKTADQIGVKIQPLLNGGAEVVVLPTNALLYNNIKTIRKATDSKKIPIVSFSSEGVKNGALFGLTSDNVELGKYMGEMVADILDKKRTVTDIKFRFPSEYKIVINMTTKNELAAAIPMNILKIATIVK
jgi:putative ABC transport system substrate-binding protein